MIRNIFSDEYIAHAWDTLNELRLKKQLCDVVLTVGEKEIHAHRNVLVTGSDYFKTMFLGNFNESAMSRIDLSSSIADANLLEYIVNFIYTGEIEVKMENFGEIMELASLLLVSSLQDHLIEFVIDNLSLDTCVDFYLYCLEYNLVELEMKLEPMVKSRFGDYHIFQDHLKELSPADVSKLYQSDCFKFCSVFLIMDFAMRWTAHRITDSHVTVVSDIIDSILKVTADTDTNTIEQDESTTIGNYVEEMSETDVNTGELKCLVQSKIDEVMKSQINPSMPMYDLLNKNSAVSKSVMVALTPTQYCFEEHEAWNFDLCLRFEGQCDQPIFDLVVYIPADRQWYYMKTVRDDFDEGSGRILRGSSSVPFEYVCKGNEVYCINYECNIRDIVSCLKVKDFSPIDKHCIISDHPGFSNGSDYMSRLVASKDDNFIYFVCRLVTDHNQVSGKMVFGDSFECQRIKCYDINGIDKTNNEEYDECDIVFITPEIKYEEYVGYRPHHVCLSNASKEMIILFCDPAGAFCCYIVDLSETEPKPCLIHQSDVEGPGVNTKELARKGVTVDILEGMDRFYIVEVRIDEMKHSGNRKIVCTLEYIYHSQDLMHSSRAAVSVPDYVYNFDTEDHSVDPFFYRVNKTNNGSLWIFSGNRQGASCFSEVTINDQGDLEVLDHVPPPFSCMTGLFSAQLGSEVLLKLKKKPIERNMEQPALKKYVNEVLP